MKFAAFTNTQITVAVLRQEEFFYGIHQLLFLLEMIGTVAFASSGALVGIRKNMDIFGVLVLGITTAVGGGCIRDLILGIHPPRMFHNFSYVGAAIVTSCFL